MSVGAAYALVDPRNGQMRYVGMSKNPVRRLREHVNYANRESPPPSANMHLIRWMRQLEANRPDLRILEECSTLEALAAAERRWIATLRALGVPLVNITDGGDRVFGRRKYHKSECSTPGCQSPTAISRRKPVPMCFTCAVRWKANGEQFVPPRQYGAKTDCEIDGCDNPSGGEIIRGMCKMHYARWRRHGHPLAVAAVYYDHGHRRRRNTDG